MCQLCNLEKLTKWYFENEKWIICDCITCQIPMAVYRKHTMKIPIQDMIDILSIIDREFGEISLRIEQRKIKDHFHFHIVT